MKNLLLIAALFVTSSASAQVIKVIGNSHFLDRGIKAGPVSYGVMRGPISYNDRTGFRLFDAVQSTRDAVKSGGRIKDSSVIKTVGFVSAATKTEKDLFEKNVLNLILSDGSTVEVKVVSWNAGLDAEGSKMVMIANDVKSVEKINDIVKTMGHGTIARESANSTALIKEIEITTYIHEGDFDQIIRNLRLVQEKISTNKLGTAGSILSKTRL